MTATLDTTTARTTVETWLAAFDRALAAGDARAAGELFAEDCYWRDLVAFTWNLKTCEGRAEIAAMLEAHARPRRSRPDWTVTDGEEPAAADGVTEAWIEFETAVGRGRGHLRLQGRRRRRAGVDAADHPLRAQGPRGAARHRAARRAPSTARTATARPGRSSASARPASSATTTQPYVLVIGGGQGGIALGARLRQLDVPTIIVDKHPRPGDQWRSRYKSLCLHDPVWYDHLPYLKFPDNWPVFAPKDKIADWLESYTQGHGAQLLDRARWRRRAAYDEATGEWTVDGRARGQAASCCGPKQLVLRHRHVAASRTCPTSPAWTSSAATSTTRRRTPARTPTRGKKCVVIGSNNSAFDICGALWENGADVTMVQRSSTHIVRSDSLMEIGLGALYSEEAVAGGHDHREGRPDLRLAAVPDHARVPDPALRGRWPSGTRTSTTGWRRPASSTTGATTGRACS